jgi:cytochrome P450
MLISFLLDAVVFLLKVLAAYIVYDRFIKLCYLRWLYGKRGVAFMSIIPLPFVGDGLEFVKRVLAAPDRPHMT